MKQIKACPSGMWCCVKGKTYWVTTCHYTVILRGFLPKSTARVIFYYFVKQAKFTPLFWLEFIRWSFLIYSFTCIQIWKWMNLKWMYPCWQANTRQLLKLNTYWLSCHTDITKTGEEFSESRELGNKAWSKWPLPCSTLTSGPMGPSSCVRSLAIKSVLFWDWDKLQLRRTLEGSAPSHILFEERRRTGRELDCYVVDEEQAGAPRGPPPTLWLISFDS